MTMSVDGLKELDAALGELPKATARSVMRSVLRKAAKPMAERARQLAPDDPTTFRGDLRRSIVIASNLKKKYRTKVGGAEFAAVMRAGGTRQEARAALIDARRGMGGTVTLYIGTTGRWTSIGHVQEFGTSRHGPQPFMRPAFDAYKVQAVQIIQKEMKGEIERAAQRLARKASRAAAKAGG